MASSLQALALSLWFGGGLSMLYGTRAIFAVADTRRQAGLFSGAILASYRLLQGAAVVLFAGAALAGLDRGQRIAGAVLVLFTLVGFFVDYRLRLLRREIGGSTEGLEAGDPRRKRFGALHGVSVLLLVAQVALAGIALVLKR